jgi:hypothetical protein
MIISTFRQKTQMDCSVPICECTEQLLHKSNFYNGIPVKYVECVMYISLTFLKFNHLTGVAQ